MEEQRKRTLPETAGPDYLIETSADPEGINAISKELVGTRFRLTYRLIGIILLIVGAFLYMMHLTFQALLCFIVGSVALYLESSANKRLAAMQLERFEARYGRTDIPIRMIFWPQGVAVLNKLSQGQSTFRYEAITRLRRYGDYLYFRDGEGHWALLRLEDTLGLTGFLDYFKAKCVNAKVKL